MTLDGWLGSAAIATSGLAPEAFLDSLLGRTMAMAPGTGDAGRFPRTTVPHIVHAVICHGFSAKLQVLHYQKLGKEEAILRGLFVLLRSTWHFFQILTQVHLKRCNQVNNGDRQKALNETSPFSLTN